VWLWQCIPCFLRSLKEEKEEEEEEEEERREGKRGCKAKREEGSEWEGKWRKQRNKVNTSQRVLFSIHRFCIYISTWFFLLVVFALFGAGRISSLPAYDIYALCLSSFL